MRIFLSAAAIAGAVLYATSAWAANSMLIESKNVTPGETGVTVGVYVENDVALSAMTLPIETREIETGSYMQGPFTFVPNGRVAASGLMDAPIQLYFSTPAGVNTCSGPVSSSWSGGTGEPNANGVADAVLWVGQETGSPCLAPGSDGAPGSGTPSFIFTFDVTTVEGRFEIDTCCTSPSTHLVFVECGVISAIFPTFTKGVITIGEPVCNSAPVDVNCDGVINVFDVVHVVNSAFRKEPPPDPCCLEP